MPAVYGKTLEELYGAVAAAPSDMQAHVPRLRELASRCGHVTEFGVRGGVSTAALAAGLPAGGRLVCYDTNPRCAKVADCLRETSGGALAVEFVCGNSLEVDIAPTDLLMIDTVHTGWHIEAELKRHATKVRKYIAMHDTEKFGDTGDDRREGMRPALARFLADNPEWRQAAHYPDSHGLTILERTGAGKAWVEVLVSAYRENLDWVRPLHEAGACIWILDKGESGTRKERCALRLGDGCVFGGVLPNVGMCDHTYLHHICERYDRLADWTVFTPDGPHDHLPEGADMVSAIEPGESLKVPRLWRGRDWGPDGRLNWHLWDNHTDKHGRSWKDRYREDMRPAALSFVEWARKFAGFDVNGPDWPGYAPGGIYAVPRRAITYLPRAFYERLRGELSHAREPEVSHYMERLWVVVFGGLAKYEPEEVTA